MPFEININTKYKYSDNKVKEIATGNSGGVSYIHPAYTALNPTLSGALVIDTITTDTIGSVLDITTRTLTPLDIGAQIAGNYVTLDTVQTITARKTIDLTTSYSSFSPTGISLEVYDAVKIGSSGIYNSFTGIDLYVYQDFTTEINIRNGSIIFNTPILKLQNIGASVSGGNYLVDLGGANGVKTRTPTQVLTDIGAQVAGNYGLSTADITAVGLTTSLLTLTRATGNLTASIPTWNQNTTGSAATLTIARTINGTSFNGSANITTSLWGTARTITIGSSGKSVNGSTGVSWSLSEIGAQIAGDYATTADIAASSGVPTTQVFTYSASNTFTLSYSSPTAIYVSLNGQIIREGALYDWTISGTTLTVTSPLTTGDEISILYYVDLPMVTNYGRNIDGGTWDSVYLAIQNINGGTL